MMGEEVAAGLAPDVLTALSADSSVPAVERVAAALRVAYGEGVRQGAVDQAAEVERLSWELERCQKDRRKLVDGAMRQQTILRHIANALDNPDRFTVRVSDGRLVVTERAR